MAEKKTKKRGKKSKKELEKVEEVFEIEKDGKTTVKKVEGEEEVVEVKKGQVKEENRILKNTLIVLGVMVAFFLGVILWMHMINTFEYREMDFNIVETEQVRFYHTAFPWFLEGQNVNYNVYLRKDPRINENVPFDGEFLFSDVMVLNSTKPFNCGGEGIVAMANFNQIFLALGTDVLSDPNASCDEFGRYIHINLEEGDETKIEQYGPKCYNFQINNCEILDVTERYLIEAVARVSS